MKRERGRVAGLVAAALFAAALLGATAPLAAQSSEATVIWLVRHAERADQQRMSGGQIAMTSDPELSDEGVRRAQHLAGMLAEAGITHVFATPYRRTQATAAPLARRLGIEVVTYEPGGAEATAAFVARLRATPGRHLVVGHSNTVPALVEALGADPHGAIADDEYDRLYQVVIGADGSVTGTLLHFGPGG